MNQSVFGKQSANDAICHDCYHLPFLTRLEVSLAHVWGALLVSSPPRLYRFLASFWV